MPLGSIHLFKIRFNFIVLPHLQIGGILFIFTLHCYFSPDTMMTMLEDNYSSEEELKEIISSEKQRKRSGGGSAKDAKSQHRENARDHRMQHRNEDGNDRKLSAKRGSHGGENKITCQSISPILSSSPSSGKIAVSHSRPSSGTSNKLTRTTPSSTSTNAAGKLIKCV